MAAFFKNKIIAGLVILLLVANIATIIVLWMGMNKMKERGKHQQPSDFIIKELALDSKQQVQYMELVKQHRNQSRMIREEIRISKDSLFILLSNEKIDENIKNQLLDKTSFLNRQLDLLTFNHFSEVRKLCKPEQQKKFDSIIAEVLKMMSGNGRGKGRPDGPPGDGPPHDGPPPMPEN